MTKATGTPKSARFTETELPDLEKAIAKAGGFKAVVMAGVRAINGKNDVSKAAVLAWIKANAAD